METFSALLVICEGNSPVTVEFPTQRPVTRSLICIWINGWGWWFDTPSRSLWRHCNVHSLISSVASSSMRTRTRFQFIPPELLLLMVHISVRHGMFIKLYIRVLTVTWSLTPPVAQRSVVASSKAIMDAPHCSPFVRGIQMMNIS